MTGGQGNGAATGELRAFYAVIAAVCYLTTVAAVLAYAGRMTEAVGVGAAITGLLALARSPARNAVNAEPAGLTGSIASATPAAPLPDTTPSSAS